MHLEAKLDNEIMRVFQDEDPEDPREWDNLGKMVCFHKRYSLGDKHHMSVNELQDLVRQKDILSLPLYLYDHSELAMSTTTQYPFDDPWDAGQVGYIYVSKEAIRKEWKKKRISRKLRTQVYNVLRQEIKTYDQWLRNDVYGFQVVKLVKCGTCTNVKEEPLDSCCGFFGYDIKTNGILEHVDPKWKNAAFEEVEE